MTLRYNLLLSVWVDPSAEDTLGFDVLVVHLDIHDVNAPSAKCSTDIRITNHNHHIQMYELLSVLIDSTSQSYPLDHHDCLFTEDDDADADTYDNSDADAAVYGGDEL